MSLRKVKASKKSAISVPVASWDKTLSVVTSWLPPEESGDRHHGTGGCGADDSERFLCNPVALSAFQDRIEASTRPRREAIDVFSEPAGRGPNGPASRIGPRNSQRSAQLAAQLTNSNTATPFADSLQRKLLRRKKLDSSEGLPSVNEAVRPAPSTTVAGASHPYPPSGRPLPRDAASKPKSQNTSTTNNNNTASTPAHADPFAEKEDVRTVSRFSSVMSAREQALSGQAPKRKRKR